MDDEILIIFGTETGNAEDLAVDIGNVANKHGLTGKIMDMEDVSVGDLSSSKRLIVSISTWGEGEQPDNAQRLFDEVERSDIDSMEGVNYAVLALGDTAFELFCESGKEWDRILEERGGTRVNERIDCDTDYYDYVDEWIQSTLSMMRLLPS
ncbi:MAG: flavodoxin domain-containing protein [Candidatus Thalassarchaeaceae archaeon]